MQMVSEKNIERLSLYRRFLWRLQAEGAVDVYSHQLAQIAGVTAAQVRRDFMAVGYSGSPARGYEVAGLAESIAAFLDEPDGQDVILVGVGNLGRAILAYFGGRRPKLRIVAAFDSDPRKTDRVIHGCRCYPADEMDVFIREQRINTAIIAVPPSEAQETAEKLAHSGVRGILNFAPGRTCVSQGVFIEDIDMAMVLEKVAFFARRNIR